MKKIIFLLIVILTNDLIGQSKDAATIIKPFINIEDLLYKLQN